MNAASKIIGDGIDDDNYTQAFEELNKILKLDGDMFKELREKMEDSSLSNEEKVMIVDRFKAIFSYHIVLSDGKNDGDYLKSLISNRHEEYKKLKGYDKSQLFPKFEEDYRKNIVNSL